MSPYSTDNYVELINEIFSTVRMIAPDRLHEERSNFSYHIAGSAHVGTYNTPDGKLLLIFSVKLQKQSGIERARSMQRNFAKKLIESGNADAALVAFYAEDDPKWRLSFVRLDYEMKIENGKLKATENLTPAKRYSFLVGDKEPCHTALSHFHSFIVDSNSNPTLDELEEAFSVERVTQEFFDLYCEKYQQLREWLVSNEDFVTESERCHFTVEQFAKKLLGQIVFLYFLQKKGWLGVGVWPQRLTEKEYKNLFFTPGAQGRIIKEYLPALYVQSGENYIQISRFRSALDLIPDDAEELIANKMPHSRNWGSGSQTFLRTLFDYSVKNGGHFYEKYLEPLFYDTLNKNRGVMGYTPILHCRVPFLSGGLFEPIDGFDWRSTHFDIPDEIFSNKKSPDDRRADGILDIFDRYNFTMSEDEPLEREVAIDPEMLGKVFENLLEVKDRKSKGAFYTPREIVHYMCRESLINYLVGQMGISESAVRDFIIYGDFMKDEDTVKSKRQGQGDMFISEEIFKIDDEGNVVVNRLGDMDQALMSVRVVDLAVGSGAFPLGLLNEIVRARETLTEYMAVAERTKAMSERQAAFMVRELRSQRTPYDLKRYTIKNSIFAADIEPSAVDIAQLRLWLSLVIDDEINPNAKSELDGHVNPMPLPNLECNILCGNSLVDEFKGTSLVLQSNLIGTTREGEYYGWHQQAYEAMLPQLIKAQDELFYCDDMNKKLEIINRIDAIRHKILGFQLEEMEPEQRKAFYAADKMSSKPFVLWQLEFARIFYEKGGFDIVIGNPPYVDSEEMIRSMPEEREFYTKRYTCTRGNWDLFVPFIEKGIDLLAKDRVISYIVPNKLISAPYTVELRKKMAVNHIVEIRDYSNVNVFKSASVYPVVFRIITNEARTAVSMDLMEDMTSIKQHNVIEAEKFYSDINWDKYFNTSQIALKIIEKMQQYPALSTIADVKGAATVNEAYLVKEFMYEDDGSDETAIKFINTGGIDKYKSYYGKEFIRYLKGKYMFPVVKQTDLKNMSEKRYAESRSEKIIIGGMNKVLECLWDNGQYLAGKSTTIVYNNAHLKYLTACLNSKLMSFYYMAFYNSMSLAGGFYRIGAPQLKTLPIAFPKEESEILRIEEAVVGIQNACEQGDVISSDAKMKEIDDAIYRAYGLSTEEIAEVEAGGTN